MDSTLVWRWAGPPITLGKALFLQTQALPRGLHLCSGFLSWCSQDTHTPRPQEDSFMLFLNAFVISASSWLEPSVSSGCEGSVGSLATA